MICKGCFYNRTIKAWGESIESCWHGVDKCTELHGDEAECSGFEPAEMQLELELAVTHT